MEENTQSYCTWWDCTLCLNTLKDSWMLECSASFFFSTSCTVLESLFLFPLSCWSSLDLSGEDGVRRTVVLYCSECLVCWISWSDFSCPSKPWREALATEMGYKVKPYWLKWPRQQWSVYTWGLTGGRNMPLYTLNVSHFAQHRCPVSPCYLVPVTWFPRLPPSHICYLSATCGFPPLYGSTNINIGDEKRSWNTALKFLIFFKVYITC